MNRFHAIADFASRLASGATRMSLSQARHQVPHLEVAASLGSGCLIRKRVLYQEAGASLGSGCFIRKAGACSACTCGYHPPPTTHYTPHTTHHSPFTIHYSPLTHHSPLTLCPLSATLPLPHSHCPPPHPQRNASLNAIRRRRAASVIQQRVRCSDCGCWVLLQRVDDGWVLVLSGGLVGGG